MILIKDFRKRYGVSQKELATLLDCAQSFVSQMESGKAYIPLNMENKMIEHYGLDKLKPFLVLDKSVEKSSLIENAIGIKDFRSPEFQEVQSQLRDLLDFIENETGLNEEQVSQEIYGKKNMIKESVRGSKINKNMAKYIYSHLDKLGIYDTSYELRTLTPHNDSLQYFPSLENLLKNKPNRNRPRYLLPFETEKEISIILRSEKTVAPIIENGDLLGINTDSEQIFVAEKVYIIITNDRSVDIKYLKNGDDTKHYIKYIGDKEERILKSDVEHIYRVNLVLKTIEP